MYVTSHVMLGKEGIACRLHAELNLMYRRHHKFEPTIMYCFYSIFDLVSMARMVV